MSEHKNYNLRMPAELKERMAVHADDSFIPQNSFILQAIKEKLDRENAPEVRKKETEVHNAN